MRPALLLCGDLNSDLNEGIPGEQHAALQRQVRLPHLNTTSASDTIMLRDNRAAVQWPAAGMLVEVAGKGSFACTRHCSSK